MNWAFLRSLLALVAIAPGCARPSNTSPVGTSLSAIEAAIIIDVLKEAFDSEHPLVVLESTTVRNPLEERLPLGGDVYEWLREPISDYGPFDLERATVDRFLDRNQRSYDLRSALLLSTNIVFADAEFVESLFLAEPEVAWRDFHQRYTPDATLVRVSCPGIGPSRRQALLYFWWSRDNLEGAEEVLFLTKSNGQWEIAGRNPIAVW